jgi:hypothetical protein
MVLLLLLLLLCSVLYYLPLVERKYEFQFQRYIKCIGNFIILKAVLTGYRYTEDRNGMFSEAFQGRPAPVDCCRCFAYMHSIVISNKWGVECTVFSGARP